LEPPRRITPIEAIISLLAGGLLVFAAWKHWIPSSILEAFANATGGVAIYLVTREHTWNFPVGIVSSVAFLFFFYQSRFFGDAGLYVIYLYLGIQGWYWWLHGGENRSPLQVRQASPKLLVSLLLLVVPGTYVLMKILERVNGSYPLLDAFLTCMSLAAQYLVDRKYIENWYLWFFVDVIYIPLFISRGYYLTAALFALFLIFCVTGVLAWRKTLHANRMEESPHPGGATVLPLDT
jgi:nicotinamide mononucleotide transporter